MAERRNRPSDAELERALSDLATAIEYPSTPPLAARVGERLAGGGSRSVFPLQGVRGALAVAAVLLLGLLLALLVASPQARIAIAERLGLRGIVILSAPTTPGPTAGSQAAATPTAVPADQLRSATRTSTTPPPGPKPSASATRVEAPGATLGLGRTVSLDEARRLVAFSILIPSLAFLGEPDAVYFVDYPAGGQVSLVYQAGAGLPDAGHGRVGLLLTEFRGDISNPLMQKSVGSGTTVQQVRVNGGLGFWIEGAPHQFLFRDRSGEVREETIRLARKVLLWEQGDLTCRLESALDRDAALGIAASLR